MDFTLKKGDSLPDITATLTQDGVAVDLTGCTIEFRYRGIDSTTAITGEAAIVDASLGTVKYEWDEDALPEVGTYEGDWRVTFPNDKILRFPNGGYIEFEVLPGAEEASETPLSSFRAPIRAYLLDNHPEIKQYAAVEIDDAVRTVVRMLRSSGKEPRLRLSVDGRAVETTDDQAVTYDSATYGKTWARIVLRAANLFCAGDSQASSYRTRALSESFGERREMVFSLLAEVYELEYGEGGE